ncbi:hypothetical protein Dimus_030532 [Dionaea muscipula]
MRTAACKEFYANLTVFIYKKKEVAKSRGKGVEIEFDIMKLASILDVPGHTGISEYIKEVWEESKRRDDDDEAPEEEVEEEEKDQTDFDWEAVVDEAAVEGESGSDEQFYDAQVDVEDPMQRLSCSEVVAQASIRRRKQRRSSRPLVSHWSNSRSSNEQITS